MGGGDGDSGGATQICFPTYFWGILAQLILGLSALKILIEISKFCRIEAQVSVGWTM